MAALSAVASTATRMDSSNALQLSALIPRLSGRHEIQAPAGKAAHVSPTRAARIAAVTSFSVCRAGRSAAPACEVSAPPRIAKPVSPKQEENAPPKKGTGRQGKGPKGGGRGGSRRGEKGREGRGRAVRGGFYKGALWRPPGGAFGRARKGGGGAGGGGGGPVEEGNRSGGGERVEGAKKRVFAPGGRGGRRPPGPGGAGKGGSPPPEARRGRTPPHPGRREARGFRGKRRDGRGGEGGGGGGGGAARGEARASGGVAGGADSARRGRRANKRRRAGGGGAWRRRIAWPLGSRASRRRHGRARARAILRPPRPDRPGDDTWRCPRRAGKLPSRARPAWRRRSCHTNPASTSPRLT